MTPGLRRARPYALLAFLCLLLYAPGIAGIPVLDRDEARFAEASRQMLESGDYVRIRFQDTARNNKPVLIYWLQAAAVDLFSSAESRAIWPYRLPSAVGASLAVFFLFALGGRLFAAGTAGSRAAFLGAVLMASSLGLVAEAHIAKTDACLLAATVAGEGALARIYLRAKDGKRAGFSPAVLFWAAEALGILLKGPIAPFVAFLTAAALSLADRDASWLRGLYPLRGLLLLALIVAPWLFLIEKETHGRFLEGALGQDFLPKLLGGEQSHGAPPGTYLLALPAYFWPGSLYLFPALVRGWQRRNAPPERFLLAWLLPAWAVFELVPTKLPHYVLPLYPALALLAGGALAEGISLPARAERVADHALKALFAVATAALAFLLAALPILFGAGFSLAALAAAALLAALGAALLLAPRRFFLVPMLSAAFVFAAAQIVLPSLDRLWLSRSAAALVAAHPGQKGTPVLAVGYSEPSLVFLLGSKTRLALPAAAAAMLAPGGRALVAAGEAKAFEKALAARGFEASPLGSVKGLDYSTGRRLVLILYAIVRG